MIARGCAVLALAVATLSAAKCPTLASSRVTAPFTPKRDAGDTSDGKLFGLRTPVTYYSQSRGILSARVGRVYDEGLRFEAEDAVFMTRDSAGRDTLRVTSPRAVYDLRIPRIVMTGGVTMTGTGGRRLTAQAIWFDPKLNVLAGDSGFVFVRAPGAPPQSGPAFEADGRLLRLTARARGAPLKASATRTGATPAPAAPKAR